MDWTGNYEITVKSALSLERNSLSNSVSLKPGKTSEEQAGSYNLSRKREKKPGDW